MAERTSAGVPARPRPGARAKLCLSSLIAVFVGTAGHGQTGRPAGVDLGRYTPVLVDDFDGGLGTFESGTGVWSTSSRRHTMVTNGPRSVFLTGAETAPGGELLGLDPFRVENGILHIGSGVIPDDKRAAVDALLKGAGQEESAGKVEYFTGRINTGKAWAQTYGYFEMVARVPVGKGHWPAFWLAPAGLGWPPEIDVFEAYGKGVSRRTAKDDTFNTAVFFDAIDPQGEATQRVDELNPYRSDAAGKPEAPDVRNKAGGEQHVFHRIVNALDEFGADIYEDFWTYAAEWTPEAITFYFGPDREHLVEVYRTPTPDDLNSPMTVIANDQISSSFGWNPVPGQDDLTFAPDNDLEIDSISIYALTPERVLAGNGEGAVLVDGDERTRIVGTAGNDVVAPGRGLDMVDLRGGRDVVHVERGPDGKIVTGFGADDRLVLEGFYFDGAEGAFDHLAQVGDDVWLMSGAYPADPQGIIFRGSRMVDFAPESFVVRWSVTPNVWSSARLDQARLSDTDGDGVVEAAASGSKMTDANRFDRPVELRGSSEPDVYYVYRSDTRIVELPGGGVDTVYTNRSQRLAAEVENLVSTSKRGGSLLVGNALGNRLESGVGSETLTGLAGDDLLDLRSGGRDTVVYGPGEGHDTIVGFGSDDVLELQGFAFVSRAEIAARLHQAGADVRLDLGEGQSVTFRGASVADLGEGRFAFTAGAEKPGTGGVDPWWRPS